MWVYRDFTKHAGMTVEKWLDELRKVELYCEQENWGGVTSSRAPFHKLVYYINHLQELSKNYLKEEEELKTSLAYLEDWKKSAEKLEGLMKEIVNQ